jgi:putative DNA primase/helicase
MSGIQAIASSIMQLGKRAGPFRLTEMGNAERFVAQHGTNARFVHDWNSWVIWNGKYFARDGNGESVRLTKTTVRSIYSEAADCEEQKQRSAIVDWAKRSEKAAQITAMLKLAQSEPGVPVSPNDLDQGTELLNVQNGTIELLTGRLRPHDRKDLFTKIAPVVYDQAAECPRWTEFLEQVFEPHRDLIPFIQRAIGYSLTGSTREECLFLLHGPLGRNGKGTFIKTIASMLGDYSLTADFSTFVAARDDHGPRDDVANMHGRRFVSAQESREGAPLAESLIKWLTGGDIVRARRLFENSWEFMPTFKLWLATNHKPTIRGTDSAIWSRIKLIPFDVSFEGREDRGLKDDLQAELTGILRWAVQGCLDWRRNGLLAPESVTDSTAEYRAESDGFGRFLEEMCVIGDIFQGKGHELYLVYRRWAEQGGEQHLMTETTFGKRLKEKGFTKRHMNNGSLYDGIGLRAQ